MPSKTKKSAAAARLGSLGGKARKAKLTETERKAIASLGGKARAIKALQRAQEKSTEEERKDLPA